MQFRLIAALALSSFATSSGHAETAVTIDDADVGCVPADEFPRLEARFTPPDSLAKAMGSSSPKARLTGTRWR